MTQITNLPVAHETTLRRLAFEQNDAILFETIDHFEQVLAAVEQGVYPIRDENLNLLQQTLVVLQHERNARVGGTVTDLRGA